jgi:hypothetical protein
MKPILFLFVAFFTLALAQGESSALPITVSGTGTQVSPFFTVSQPWFLQIQSGEVSAAYLYDATTRRTLRKLTSDTTIEETGTFFVFVQGAEGASWEVLMANVGGPTEPTEPETATPETTELETTEPETPEPETISPEATSPETAEPASGLPPVDKRTLTNWNRHLGYEVSRYTRSDGTTSGDCSSYPGALEAQRAFITAGGPELDPENLDSDGDGYACSYDPFDTSYAAAITCETGNQWINPRYRKDGTYNRGGCRPVKTE